MQPAKANAASRQSMTARAPRIEKPLSKILIPIKGLSWLTKPNRGHPRMLFAKQNRLD
jgi:hypothetical protein